MNDKIDVVIPWVDDNDELWLKKEEILFFTK
ncbi:Stealth CR1 domain-containing protein [Paucilactobacillus hokkaidonensis]|nr:Stealth CR1 domain-containing protein [Paucilactobacillus hokkaidonensis]